MSKQDAELIELCEAANAIEQRITAHFGATVDVEPAANAYALRQADEAALDALLARACAIRATTSAGILARVRSIALMNPHGKHSLDIGPKSNLNVMVAALLRDALLLSAIPVSETIMSCAPLAEAA